MKKLARNGEKSSIYISTGGGVKRPSEVFSPTPRGRSARRQTHCTECLGALRHGRVLLKCRHYFCLECAHALERGSRIKCPLCLLETQLESSLHVKHLPEVATVDTTKKGVVLVKAWTPNAPVHDVMVLDDKCLIYIATADQKKPLQVYDYKGTLTSVLPIPCVRMARDTKRDRLLTIAGKQTFLTLYTTAGAPIGEFSNPYFRGVIDVAYHPTMDLYLVTDAHLMCIFAVNPTTRYIVRTFGINNTGTVVTPRGEIINANVACSREGALWTVCNRSRGLVSVLDGEGEVVRRYGGEGSGDRQLRHPSRSCIDHAARVIVADAGNARVVRFDLDHVGDDAEWGVIVKTREFALPRPRAVDVTQDGHLVVSACDDLWDGPFYVAIFKGVG